MFLSTMLHKYSNDPISGVKVIMDFSTFFLLKNSFKWGFYGLEWTIYCNCAYTIMHAQLYVKNKYLKMLFSLTLDSNSKIKYRNDINIMII